MFRLVLDKLKDPGTYMLTLVVGTLINVYGQILVPWLRGSGTPLDDMWAEAVVRPGLMATSLGLGYAFPLLVSVYSSAVTRTRLEQDGSI